MCHRGCGLKDQENSNSKIRNSKFYLTENSKLNEICTNEISCYRYYCIYSITSTSELRRLTPGRKRSTSGRGRVGGRAGGMTKLLVEMPAECEKDVLFETQNGELSRLLPF